MDLILLFTAIKVASCIFEELITSSVGSLIYDKFLRKTEGLEEAKLLNKFLKDVDKCMMEAAQETGIELEVPEKDYFRETWLKSIFSNSRQYEVVGFLPNFGPIVVLKKAIEDNLKNKIEAEKCQKFIKIFNWHLIKLDYELPDSDTPADSIINNLNKYLSRVKRVVKKKMTPFERLVFIEPYGAMRSADKWRSLYNPTLNQNGSKKARGLLEEYFEKKQYISNEGYRYPILFLCADSGIGKSCFIRNYVLNLARDFEKRADGFLPVYFEFKKYDKPDRLIDYLRNNHLLSPKTPQLMLFLDGLDGITPLETDRIRDAIISVERLLGDVPQNYRIIISTRPIFGETGIISDYIQQYQEGLFLHLFGFIKPEQIDEWFHILGKKESFPRLRDYDNTHLQALDINADLFQKPLSLTFLSDLIQNLPDDANLSRIDGTGLYLSHINLLTKRIAESAKTDTNELGLKQANIRNLLQKISAISNIKGKGLDEKQIELTIDDDVISVFKIYKDMRLST